jgi:hypothetical protein
MSTRKNNLLAPCCWLTLAAGLAGCQAIGAAAYKFSGPAAVEAKHPLGTQPVLVMVEKFENPAAAALDSEQLGHFLQEELRQHTTTPVVDQSKLTDLKAAKGPAYREMKVQEVGRAAGAAQVLYVDLVEDSVDATAGGELLKGTVAVRVKVVDATSGATLWPTDMSNGLPMRMETPYNRQSRQITQDSMRRELMRGMAERVGRLFYKWKPEEEEKPE